MKPSEVAMLYQRTGLPAPVEFRDVKAVASKLGNVAKVVGWISFQSSLEAQAYQILLLWQKAGAIRNLELQPAFLLQMKMKRDGKTIRPITWRADFRFFDVGQSRVRVIDAKGYQTEMFRLKMKLLAQSHPEVRVELWDRQKITELRRGI